MNPSYDLVDEAAKPKKRAEPYYDWQDDGLLIVRLLESKDPKHTAAIAKLYEDCPHKYSIDIRTGERTAVRPHTVAAWAGKIPAIVQRLKARKLI